MNRIYLMAASAAIIAILGTGCAAGTNVPTESVSEIVESIPDEYTAEAIAERAATEDAEAASDATTEAMSEDTEEDVTEVSTEDAAIEGSTESNGYLVVLDPGHASVVSGNTEPLYPGASEMKAADAIGTHGDASGLMEYQLTLTICEKAAAALEEEGYEVILTRTDNDHAISCAERAEIANNADADVYIRVHANGVNDSSVTGAMTICVTESNPNPQVNYSESSRLSEVLLDEYVAATGRRKERVWYTDSMTGNNWATVPTTLLEMGYMTNADEDLWMASEDGQEQIVTGIVNGIDRYLGTR